MVERATTFQTVQIGVESTPGVPVAATKRLQSLSIDPSPKFQADDFQPQGTKFNTLVVLGKEWSEYGLGGRPVFDEIHYFLASLCSNVSPTNPGSPASPVARNWTYSINNTGPDTPATFTVEQGSAARAQQFANFIITELGFVFTRDSVEVSGSGLGKNIVDGFTLSGGATTLPLVPILPKQIDIYLDSTSAGLGTTKLLRCIRAEWRISNRFMGIWPLNSANFSWDSTVESDPTFQVTLRLEADAQGMGLLSSIRAGTTQFLRIKCQGGFIDSMPTVAITSSTSASPPVWTTATHSLAIGDTILIAGNSIPGYNRLWIVGTPNFTTTTFTLVDPLTGLAQANLGASTGGTLAKQVNPYLLQLDNALQVKDAPSGYQDDNGLYCIDWQLTGVFDGTFGKAFSALVTNKQTAL